MADACQVRESWMNTEPALAVTCMSPGIGAVTVMPSPGPRGLRASRWEPGTTQVAPESASTSVRYQIITRHMVTSGNGWRMQPAFCNGWSEP